MAYFTRARSEHPALSISHAVFLPVGDAVECCPISEKDGGRWGYHLVLHDIPVDNVFGDEGKLQYLTLFLKSLPETAVASQSIARRLLGLARRAFRDVPLRRLRSHRAAVQRFLAFVPPQDRLAVGLESAADSEDVLESPPRLDLAVLLLPREFEPEQPSAGSLSAADAARILEALADPQRGGLRTRDAGFGRRSRFRS